MPFTYQELAAGADYANRVVGVVEGGDVTGSDVRALSAPLSGIVLSRPQMFNLNPAMAGRTVERFPNALDRLAVASLPGGLPQSDVGMLSRVDVGTAAGREIRFGPQMIPKDRVGMFNRRAKAGRNATMTGLVYARPDNIDQSMLRSSGMMGKSDMVSESAKRAFKEVASVKYDRSPLSMAGNAWTNLRTDRALAKAAKKGYRGEEALEFVTNKVPSARDRVSLKLSKDKANMKLNFASDDPISAKSVTKGSTSPGIMSRKTSSGGFKVNSKTARTARTLVKYAPVVGAALDAKELWDELNEDEVEVQEVVGAALDLALGVTGVGGIVGDVFGVSYGSDGGGSALVDLVGNLTGWWDADED